jgi:sugar/nucleoside kinase (ribokinase family)
MSPAARPPAGAGVHYVAVGHVTVDVLADGTRRPGGTAFYSALQASRLGARAHVITRGDPSEIERLLAPFAAEITLEVQPAAHTTTLATEGFGATRRQRMLAWAGAIEPRAVAATIVHLAPIAAELDEGWRGLDGFTGLTPQGLVRRWDGPGEEVVLVSCPPGAEAFAARVDALVVSAVEQACCEPLVERAVAAGATVAITAGTAPTRLRRAHTDVEVPVPSARLAAVDDLGAGDVFAAALFMELARGGDAIAAVRFAHAAAATRVLGAGAGAIGDRAAVQAQLRP